MMTVPMDKTSHPSSKESVKRPYNKNAGLKNRRLSAQARIPSDPNAWQQIRENFEAMIVQDHVSSEQHEIEYALWQLHYKRIEELRAHLSSALASASRTSPTEKGSMQPCRITKIRSQLKTFLSEATGFYHDLMLKIRAKYGLPLGDFSDDPENQIFQSADENKSAEMKKGLISCHRCLIYLGDLARYKGLYGEGDSKDRDLAAASSYYMQASSLWPSSGNPHHQLAILASYSGDELVSVYRYFRSLAIDNPFPTARDNLIMAFEKNRQSYSELLLNCKASSAKSAARKTNWKGRGKGEGRLSSKECKAEANSVKKKVTYADIFKTFSIRFIRLNGILFTRTSLETFEEVLANAKIDLIQLLSSGTEEYSVESGAAERGIVIVRIIAILIFTVHNAYRKTDDQAYAEVLQGSVLLSSAFTATFEFMGQIFEKCLQLPDPSTSYLSSGVLVFVEWLACRPDVAAGSEVEVKQEKARSFFWNSCISLLNKLLLNECLFNDDKEDQTFFNLSRYDESETGNNLALWEDLELRGFQPLAPAHLALDFSRKCSLVSDGGIKEKRTRMLRIIAAGKALVNVMCIEQQGVYFDSELQKFVLGIKPQLSNDELITSSLEGLTKHPEEIDMNKISVEPKLQCYMDGEEEDEVIVFKPSVSDKKSNIIARKVTLEALSPVSSVESVHPRDGLMNAFDISFRPPSLANIVPEQQLQPNQSNNFKLLLEQLASFSNGLNKLNLEENGIPFKHEFQEDLTHFSPTTVSPHYSHGVNLSSGSMYSGQGPEIPSKFDPIISSGASSDNITVKKTSALPARSVRTPVSRPRRHVGPPPGFSYAPPKIVDEPFSNGNMESSNLPLDDYSWLDGYQLSSTNGESALNHSVKNSGLKYNHAILNNNLIGTVSFPFPGKEVPEKHLHFEKGNQLSKPMLDQYHGRSIWEGNYFV